MNNLDRSTDVVSFDDFRTFDGKPDIPAPLEDSNFARSSSTIFAVVGTNENVLVVILFSRFKTENVELIN